MRAAPGVLDGDVRSGGDDGDDLYSCVGECGGPGLIECAKTLRAVKACSGAGDRDLGVGCGGGGDGVEVAPVSVVVELAGDLLVRLRLGHLGLLPSGSSAEG
jgi:hypothetical protein